MSFDFSDLVIPDEIGDNYDYSQFLSEPIYDWLNFPDAVLQACDDLEEEKPKKTKSYNYSTSTTRKYSYMEKSIISSWTIS